MLFCDVLNSFCSNVSAHRCSMGLTGRKRKLGQKRHSGGSGSGMKSKIREMEVRTCDRFVIKGLMWRTRSCLSPTRVRVRNTRTQTVGLIFLWHGHVQKRNTEKRVRSHTLHKAYLPPSCTPQRAALSLLCHLYLSNNPLPREKQSVLDLKEKGPCLYHVQLSSHQNASALVRRKKCCHWGVVPFIRRLSRMEIMG